MGLYSVHLDELDLAFWAFKLLFEVGALDVPSIVLLSLKHFVAGFAFKNFIVLEMHLTLVSVDLTSISEAEVAERALVSGHF